MNEYFGWFITFSDEELWAMAAVLAFMLFDIMVGTAQAVVNQSFTSSKMREGLVHKSTLILCLLLAVLLQGFISHAGDMDVTVPTVYGVSALIVVMEVASILENILKLNPDLKDTELFKIFGGGDSDESNHDDAGNG